MRLAAWSEAQNIRLQALSHTVTGATTYGYRRDHIRSQARLHTVTGAPGRLERGREHRPARLGDAEPQGQHALGRAGLHPNPNPNPNPNPSSSPSPNPNPKPDLGRVGLHTTLTITRTRTATLTLTLTLNEQAYGREYDLDVYHIVAVNDFNMGAMENKVNPPAPLPH